MDTHIIPPPDGLPVAASALIGALKASAPDRAPLPRFALAAVAASALGDQLGGAVQHELRYFDLSGETAVAGGTLPAGRYLAWTSVGIDRSLDADDPAPLVARLRDAGVPQGAPIWSGEGRTHMMSATTRSITGGPGAELTVRYACGMPAPDGPLTVAGARDLEIGLVPAWVPGRIALVLGGTPLSAVVVRENGLDGWSADVIGAPDAWQERLQDELAASGYERRTDEIARVDGEPVMGTVLRLERGGNIVTVTVGVMRAGGPIEVYVTRQRGLS